MNAAKKFKKLPVVIMALQFRGDNVNDIVDFCGSHIIGRIEKWAPFKLKTLEGEHIASIGDFIICGVNGEFYPCKPDIFVKTYVGVE